MSTARPRQVIIPFRESSLPIEGDYLPTDGLGEVIPHRPFLLNDIGILNRDDDPPSLRRPLNRHRHSAVIMILGSCHLRIVSSHLNRKVLIRIMDLRHIWEE